MAYRELARAGTSVYDPRTIYSVPNDNGDIFKNNFYQCSLIHFNIIALINDLKLVC